MKSISGTILGIESVSQDLHGHLTVEMIVDVAGTETHVTCGNMWGETLKVGETVAGRLLWYDDETNDENDCDESPSPPPAQPPAYRPNRREHRRYRWQ